MNCLRKIILAATAVCMGAPSAFGGSTQHAADAARMAPFVATQVRRQVAQYQLLRGISFSAHYKYKLTSAGKTRQYKTVFKFWGKRNNYRIVYGKSKGRLPVNEVAARNPRQYAVLNRRDGVLSIRPRRKTAQFTWLALNPMLWPIAFLTPVHDRLFHQWLNLDRVLLHNKLLRQRCLRLRAGARSRSGMKCAVISGAISTFKSRFKVYVQNNAPFLVDHYIITRPGDHRAAVRVLKYKAFHTRKGVVWLPVKIRLQSSGPIQRGRMIITFRHIKIDPVLPPSLFKINYKLAKKLILRTKTGYAVVPTVRLRRGSKIAIKPWCTVSGVVDYRATNPRTQRSVSVFHWPFNVSAPVNARGNFVLRHVPAGHVKLCLTDGDEASGYDGSMHLLLRPGQHKFVHFKKLFPSVIGRVLRSKGKRSTAELSEPIEAQLTRNKSVPYPKDWFTINHAARVAWMKRWEKTPAGRRWATPTLLVVHVRKDGSFVAPEVPPGKYDFMAYTNGPVPGHPHMDASNAEVDGEVVIRKNAPANQPINLGNLRLQRQHTLNVGEAAPAWKLATLTGGTVRLSQFKGKCVLLDFWATWCPPCRAQTPFLKKLYAKYRGTGKLAIVSATATAI